MRLLASKDRIVAMSPQSLRYILVYSLICFLLFACKKREVKAFQDPDPCHWFEKPPAGIEITTSVVNSIISDQLKASDYEPVMLRIHPSASASDFYELLYELSLYRTHVYIVLENGECLHYGYPLTDMHVTHPWYKAFSTHPLLKEKCPIYTVELKGSRFQFNGNGIDRIKLMEIIGGLSCDKQAVFVLNLVGNVSYGDVDLFLQILWELKIKRYVISFEGGAFSGEIR